MRRLLLIAILVSGCSTSLGPLPGGPGGGQDPTPITGASWSGRGFVVHEWGTNTVVVGSDGALQRGLHHEEEDLPGFVYDRVAAGRALGPPSVEVKMETPVLYFYSDAPVAAQVQVGFPAGVMTQWYPQVQGFSPPVATPDGDPANLGDPVLDLKFPLRSQQCLTDYRKIANGMLDWGTVQVLGRDQTVDLPDAPLDTYTWSHARAVQSNAVRVAGAGTNPASQDERFLFYRGLGNFDLPVSVDAHAGVTLSNGSALPVGAVVTIDVSDAGGAFTVYPAGLAAGGALTDEVQAAEHRPIDEYAQELSAALTRVLDGTGLYHDEAVAMVNTWSRQWFRTPGPRVLYLAPQAWTEAQLPLTIAPAPEQLVRVMMIRVEVLTPGVEAADQLALSSYPSDPAGAQAYFQALGRFGEPRLRNASRLLGDPSWAQPLIDSVATADTRNATG